MRLSTAFGIALIGGCSLNTTPYGPCESSQACQDAFGILSTCGEDGFCAAVETAARCSETLPLDLIERADTSERLLLGSVFDRSTPGGRGRAQAVEIAVRILNESGGVDGRELGLVQCTIELDEDRFPESTVTDALRASVAYLDAVGGLVVIGGDDTSTTSHLATEAFEHGMPVVTPVPADPWLDDVDPGEATLDSPGWLWSTVPQVRHMGTGMGLDIVTQFPEQAQVTVISDATDYGEAVLASLEATLSPRVPTVFTVDVAETENLRNVIDTIASSATDVVVYAGARRVAELLELAAERKTFQGKGVVLSDAAAFRSVLNENVMARDLLYDWVRGVRPAIAEPSRDPYAQFASAYTAVTGEPLDEDLGYAASYDAAWMAVAAVASALSVGQDPEPSTIASGFRKLSDGPSFEAAGVDWPGTVERLLGGNSVNLVGASGELDFDSDEQVLPRIEVWEIEERSDESPRYRVRSIGIVEQ
ncbi:MAG: ABC transporter substrate-binding protein [Myxococcota bacterium]